MAWSPLGFTWLRPLTRQPVADRALVGHGGSWQVPVRERTRPLLPECRGWALVGRPGACVTCAGRVTSSAHPAVVGSLEQGPGLRPWLLSPPPSPSCPSAGGLVTQGTRLQGVREGRGEGRGSRGAGSTQFRDRSYRSEPRFEDPATRPRNREGWQVLAKDPASRPLRNGGQDPHLSLLRCQAETAMATSAAAGATCRV